VKQHALKNTSAKNFNGEREREIEREKEKEKEKESGVVVML
jgi:hypothetical protein